MAAGQILLKHGLLDAAELARAGDAQLNGASLHQTAIEMGLVSETEALRALVMEVGMPLVDLEEAEVDLSLLAIFPQRLIHRNGLFPISQSNGSVVVATSDPFNLYSLDVRLGDLSNQARRAE